MGQYFVMTFVKDLWSCFVCLMFMPWCQRRFLLYGLIYNLLWLCAFVPHLEKDLNLFLWNPYQNVVKRKITWKNVELIFLNLMQQIFWIHVNFGFKFIIIKVSNNFQDFNCRKIKNQRICSQRTQIKEKCKWNHYSILVKRSPSIQFHFILFSCK